MKILITIVALATAQCIEAADELLSEEEILDLSAVHENYCEPTQSFRWMGESEDSYYRHIVQENYKYSSGCAPLQGSVSLYRQEGDRYRKLWSKSAGDSSVGLRLSMKRHSELFVLVFNFSDGGNGNISHQTTYILDENDSVLPLDESAVHDWAEEQLLSEQRIHASDRTSYTGDVISYHARVMDRGAHRHSKPYTRLLVEAEIAKVESSYELIVTNAYNVGKSHYQNDQGLDAYRIKDFGIAISRFKQSIASYPRNWQAHTNLGLAHLQAGAYDLSIKASTVVLDSDQAAEKFKANAAYNIGLIYETEGILDKALRYYVRANQLSPSRIRREAVARLEVDSTGTESVKFEYPNDIRVFVERREVCDHLRGEEAYDDERAINLYEQMLESCKGTDKELRLLKERYLSDNAIAEMLAEFEVEVEPRFWHPPITK